MSRHVPPLKRTVEDLLSNRLSTVDFPCRQLPRPPRTRASALPCPRAHARPGRATRAFPARPPRAHCAPTARPPRAHRTPTCAPAALTVRFVSSPDGSRPSEMSEAAKPGGAKPFNPFAKGKVASPDVPPPAGAHDIPATGRRLVVFVLGGLTYSELRAMHEVSTPPAPVCCCLGLHAIACVCRIRSLAAFRRSGGR